ncbi:integral membrane protein [Streptomyces sp. e14]|uniref:hypothetical protein n=1 Tax=Streptomyces sp. e14 TaxID=645465 RepID=UPI0001D06E01|nr:hypothetical protein [Streptomyces sp. e14]EFF91932.1 integral membrane protein [Streptomyces sp. e14]
MTAPHARTATAGRDLRLLRAAVFAAVCVVLAAAGHTLASCATVPLWTLAVGFLGSLVLVAPLAGRARSLPGIAALLALGQTVLHTLFGLGQHGMGAANGMSGMAGMPGMASGSTAGMGSGSMAAMDHAHALSDATLVERAAHYVCGGTGAAISPARAYRILVDAHLYSGPAPSAAQHPADALTTGGAAASLLPSLPMLLVHVLAALAAGWLLRRGDLALLRLIELSAHGVAEGALMRSLRGALALVCALCAGLPTAPGTGPRFARTADSTPLTPPTTALLHTVIRRGPPAAALALAA